MEIFPILIVIPHFRTNVLLGVGQVGKPPWTGRLPRQPITLAKLTQDCYINLQIEAKLHRGSR